LGEASVILFRDKYGAIHVFLNSCRHRGMKVCRYEQGNTSTFTCAYYSRSHTTDGKLQSLIEVAKLMNYKGTIWATWDPEAPDFLAYLGDAEDHLDQVLDCRDRREGGYEVIGVHKWVFSANWNFAAENFLGRTYHNPSHRSVDMVGIGPSAATGKRGRRDDELEKAQRIWVSFPQGHGVHSALNRKITLMCKPFSIIQRSTSISIIASMSASAGKATSHA
jgi:Rieske [2Fe-2S] domain